MAEQTTATIKLEFGIEKKALLRDVSSVLYDFELLYDFLVLSNLEEYKEYRFTQYFWYRKGRPLEDVDRLRLVEIRKGSPLILGIVVGAFVLSQIAIPLFTIFERISDRKLNRQKLELEVAKLRSEVELLRSQRESLIAPQYEMTPLIEEKARVKLEKAKVELDQAKLGREKSSTMNSILRRLQKSPIKLEDISITNVEATNESK